MSSSPSFLLLSSLVPVSCVITLPSYLVLSLCLRPALGCMRCFLSFIYFHFIVYILGQFTLLFASLIDRDNSPVFSSLSHLISPVRPFLTHHLFAKMC